MIRGAAHNASSAALPRVLRLHPADPVAVALTRIGQGDEAGMEGVCALAPIPPGHKLALRPIRAGETILKLGLPIGVARSDIDPGAHVHTHNLAFAEGLGAMAGVGRAAAPVSVPQGATFDGFVRADGRVGTRNYLLVLATVNCSATVVRQIATRFRATVDLSAMPHIDGVIGLASDHGCTVRADGPGMALLRRTLAGYARHPNVAGVLVVGLGCEDNDVNAFLAASGLSPSERLTVRVIQQEGGTAATVAAGVAALQAMLPAASAARRTPVSVRNLTVGLQCGGSDGFSAITANPAVGRAVDRLVAEGGTAILSETPEIHGAESLLLDRAADAAVAARLSRLLAWWADHARRDGGTLDNNPSPGNKEGGITTILEKSLGAVAKGGSSALRSVYDYAERIRDHGLVFMDSPGSDAISATGQVASGANLICFTTGRGSCFGAAPAPSVKVATTTELFQRMRGDMDLDAGPILRGSDLDEVADTIFRAWLAVASGERTASERLGYGEEEFSPWVPGLIY